MTFANHALAGTIVAASGKNPVLALTLAFASHYVLDALPHYGYSRGGFGEIFKHRLSYVVQLLTLVSIAALWLVADFGFNIVLLAAIIAVSPDFEWFYRYWFYERKNLDPPKTRLTVFHQRIQWCERPWGFIFEIVFFIYGLHLLGSI